MHTEHKFLLEAKHNVESCCFAPTSQLQLVWFLNRLGEAFVKSSVSREDVVVITQCGSLGELKKLISAPFVLPLCLVGLGPACLESNISSVLVFCSASICMSSPLGGKLPFDDASVGAVQYVIKKAESFGDQFVAEISRVLKADGIVLVQSFTPSSDQKPNSYIERQLLMGGFVEVQASTTSSQNGMQSVTVSVPYLWLLDLWRNFGLLLLGLTRSSALGA